MTTDKLQLAVNQALNDYRLARARMSNLMGGQGIDNKRPQAWCEYGFPESLDFADFYKLYRRGGIAHGVVEKIIGGCWKTNPWLIEGDDQDNAKGETAWERGLKPLFKGGRFWRKFAEADRRRLVGRYSGLLLRLRDSKPWSEPVDQRSKELVDIIPAWAGSLKPIRFGDDERQPDAFGLPTMWQYTEVHVSADGAGGQQIVRDVHPDRVFILGDWRADAIGFLEPAYNAFVSLEKVEGGSGESFLKNAARQLGVNFDKEINLRDIADAYGVDFAQLQERFNEAARDLNRGNDTLMITQGATVTPLVSPVSDPTPTYDVNLQTAAAAVDIPTKVIVGMQTGERASSEDQKYMNARCQGRRPDLSYEISDMFSHLMRIGVVDKVQEYTVMWDDLTEATQADKLASAKTMSEINTSSLGTGEMIFTGSEIREAAGYDPLEEIEPLPDVDDDEGEDGDPAKE